MLKGAVQSGLSLLTGEKHPSAEDHSNQKQQEDSAVPRYNLGDLRNVAKSCNLILGVTGITAIGNKSMHGSSPGLLPRAD